MQVCHSITMPQSDDCRRLLQAVARDPRDLTLRLVLADAIEEEGGFEEEAQWLRVITRDAMDNRIRWPYPHAHPGVANSRQGIAREAAWARFLGAPQMVSGRKTKKGELWGESTLFRYHVVNGFPATLTIDPSIIVKRNVGDWLRYCPVEEVRLRGISVRRSSLDSGWYIESGHGLSIFEFSQEWARLRGGQFRFFSTKAEAIRLVSHAAVNVLRRAAGYPDLYHPEPAKATGIT